MSPQLTPRCNHGSVVAPHRGINRLRVVAQGSDAAPAALVPQLDGVVVRGREHAIVIAAGGPPGRKYGAHVAAVRAADLKRGVFVEVGQNCQVSGVRFNPYTRNLHTRAQSKL